MASIRIRYGDEEYDTLHRAWLSNGRPAQFDRAGLWGGALYRVFNPEGVDWDASEYPDFYQVTSRGPTTVDETTGKVVKEGWHLVNLEDGMSIEISEKGDSAHGDRVEVSIGDLPQDLTPAETV